VIGLDAVRRKDYVEAIRAEAAIVRRRAPLPEPSWDASGTGKEQDAVDLGASRERRPDRAYLALIARSRRRVPPTLRSRSSAGG
jgi:hypothetical protein